MGLADSESHVGGRVSHRAAWGILDQVVFATSNLVLTILAARTLSPEAFGGVAVALTVYGAAVFLARGVTSDPLTTAYALVARGERRPAIRAAAATTLVMSSGLAVATLLVALVAESVRGPLLVLAVLLPGLVLQDYLRFVLVIDGRAKATFLNDLFWLVALVPVILVADWLDGGPVGLVLAWGLIGNVAALLGLWQARTGVGSLRSVRPWLRRHRDLWPYFLTDNLVYQSTILILVLVISWTASLAEVGAFRGAMMLYSPLANLCRGVIVVAGPELARRRTDSQLVKRKALQLAWVITAFALGWAVFLPLIPTDAGRMILGDTWPLAQPLLVWAGASAAASVFTSAVAAGLKALGAGRQGLAARTVVSVLILVCAAAGGFVDGAYGVMVALALSAPLQVLTYWWLLVRAASVDAPGLRDGRPLP